MTHRGFEHQSFDAANIPHSCAIYLHNKDTEQKKERKKRSFILEFSSGYQISFNPNSFK